MNMLLLLLSLTEIKVNEVFRYLRNIFVASVNNSEEVVATFMSFILILGIYNQSS